MKRMEIRAVSLPYCVKRDEFKAANNWLSFCGE